MEVKFTFEDGSEAIAHYGVKGMKWKKHKAQEEGYQIDPDKFGYENTEAGRLAAYRESGLNSHMSREQAARYMAKSNAKWEHEKKQRGVKLNKHGVENSKMNKKLDKYLVNSLPTRKQKQKNERKAALKARLAKASSQPKKKQYKNPLAKSLADSIQRSHDYTGW